jgi:WD40 repeat protein/class 3 adenylate cyclase
MYELPAGTVTFLFTDITGSTTLLKQLGSDRYGQALTEHRSILREAFEQHNGREVDNQGDAFFVSFQRATEAVAAVVSIQRTLAEHEWPDDVELRLRMGLHTGEPWLIEEGYVGMDVHRASRIAHVGHGGQVLLSETTTSLVLDNLPEGVDHVDLGQHRLKDMRRPEVIHQLVIEGLPAKFPPLNSLEIIITPTSTEAEVVAHPLREVGSSPYQGLAAFGEGDAEFFFGRETFIGQLSDSIHKSHLVPVIVGSSGSGKSSAVFAGLLPALRAEGDWLIASVRPGSHPFHALASILLNLLEPDLDETDRLLASQKLANGLFAGEVTLFHTVTRLLQKRSEANRLLLVVDQFEEIYTLCRDISLRESFLDELLATVDAEAGSRTDPFVMLFTLRADFMGQALTHRPLADAMQKGSLMLGPMNQDELRAAIEKPAELQGAAFEAGLVSRILDDIGEEPGNLPLLEFALTLLWEEMEEGWMTHAVYEQIGRVQGALARYADQVFTEFDREEQEQAKRIFVQLVQPGQGTEDTRRVAKRSDLVGVEWSLVQHLADQRLVVTGLDETNTETVEVVHEALIRGWGQLLIWMASDRDFRNWQEGLRVNLRTWEINQQDEGTLLRGAPLIHAEEWLERRSDEIGEAEFEFIQASLAFQQKRKAQQERQRRLIIGGLAAGLVIALLLSLFAFNQRSAAEANAARAEAAEEDALRQASIGLAALAEGELGGINRERAVLLALEAMEHYPYTSQAAGALALGVEEFRAARLLDSSKYVAGNIMVATWSPDGKRIAGGSHASPNSIVIWDAATGRVLLSIDAHGNPCTESYNLLHDLAWSPEGDRLAAIAQDSASREACGTVVLNTASGETILTLVEYESAARSLDWSSDGAHILTGHEDGVIRLWDARTGAEHLTLTGHTGMVRDAVFSPDGSRIATASEDGTVRLWDAETGTEQMKLSGHAGPVRSVVWSPDGTRLVSGGNDGLPRIWDAVSGETLLVLPGHTEDVVIVTWSLDGRRIASQGLDAIVKVWDAATSGLIFQITNAAPESGTKRGFIQFSPDGNWILVGGTRVNGTRIWDTSTSVPILFGHTFGQEWGGWSPDGRLIATSGTDGSARLWDAITGQQLREFDRGSYWSDWSPDGTRLVFADGVEANTLTIWDVATGEMLSRLSAPEDEYGAHQFLTMNWSPDGSFIAAADLRPGIPQQAVYVWDAETTEIVSTLQTDDICMQGWPRWSPDSTRIATGCIFVEAGIDTPARIWDAANGREIIMLESEYGWNYRAEWSPDGVRILTTYGNGAAVIWDVETGEQLLTFTGHQGVVDGVWSPDGTLIASTDFAEQLVKIWDPDSGEELMGFSVPGAPLTIGWSPDGTHVIVTGDGINEPIIKRVWKSTEDLIAYAYDCCVFRELTPDERLQFGLPPVEDQVSD